MNSEKFNRYERRDASFLGDKRPAPLDVARQGIAKKRCDSRMDESVRTPDQNSDGSHHALVSHYQDIKIDSEDNHTCIVKHVKIFEEMAKNTQKSLQEKSISAEVPHHRAFLPDGDKVMVYGDPEKYARFNHQQGDNSYGYQQDCGLVSCQDVLNQFDVGVSETDVVGFAIKHGLCESTRRDASASGGTTLEDQVKILQDYHVPAHAETGKTMQDLASHIEHNKGVIIEVNAGVLWNDPHYFENGASNHAIVVTGDVRDLTTGNIRGFYINDSGAGNSGKFIDVQTMRQAWEKPGGACVVTDIPHGTTLG